METNNDIGAAVKQKLDGFKNSPDDMVWNHIEAQLKKKKKRRLFILLFSGLGLSALFLLLWINNPLQNTIQTEVQNTNAILSDDTTETSTYKNSNLINSNTDSTITIEEYDSIHNVQKLNEDQKSKSTGSKEKQSHITKNKTSNPKSPATTEQSSFNSNLPITNNIKVALDETKRNTSNKTDSQITNLNHKKDTQRDREIINNTIEKQEDSIAKQDALTKLISEEKEKEKDSVIQDNTSRWSVTPQALLSYYGALSSKSSDNFSINYGLLLSYRVTERTFLRIGTRKLNLNQNIDGFVINTEYLEFPIDIKYTPFDKKLNPYFTGGISYFILQKATINQQSNSNYNTTFSLHTGIGIEYKLLKDFYFNLESNFNYQIKPISQNNDINPFILSLSTGIEYRF